MKSTITLAAGLLLSSAALAQSASQGKIVAGAKGKVAAAVQDAGASKVGEAISASVDKLQEAVLAGDLSPRNFEGMKASIQKMGQGMSPANPMATELGARLQRRLADLQKRTEAGKATAQDFAILREQVLDTRLDHAISQIATSAKQSSASPEQLAQISTLLQARGAAVAEIDPQAAQGNQSVIRVASSLQKKASAGSLELPDLSMLKAQLAEARLDRAMTDLQQRAVAKTASAEDYTRVNEVLADRTRVIATPAAKELETSLKAALGRLKTKADGGNISKAEFTALRDELVKKARAAAAVHEK